ncbi:MAG: FAD binding domain-containing protein, partial [Chloroflexota bacterium]
MISPFDLYRPSPVLEASAAMVADDDAIFYAGGTELLILMKNRILEPTLLVDLKH